VPGFRLATADANTVAGACTDVARQSNSEKGGAQSALAELPVGGGSTGRRQGALYASGPDITCVLGNQRAK